MKNLPIDLNSFEFFEREKVSGKAVKNRCGRDFLFYALAYYFPGKFGMGKLTAYDLEHNGYFGISVPAYLAWAQIQFLRMPDYLRKQGLQLSINDRKIDSFTNFVSSILFSRISFDKAITNIEDIIDKSEVAGVDISIGYRGLLDHVLFVYGYDADNLYVFETTITPIQYARVSEEHKQMMKISKNEIKNRWTNFGRVWHVLRSAH